jgi:hypothetical protein
VDSAHSMTVAATRPGHPLADRGRPVPIAVIILIGVLAWMGWTDEQIVTLTAVLIGAAAGNRP